MKLILPLFILIAAFLGCSSPTTENAPLPALKEIAARQELLDKFSAKFNQDIADEKDYLHLSLTGEHSDTVIFTGKFGDHQYYAGFLDNTAIRNKIRQTGFRYLIFDDGQSRKTIDLLKQ